MEFGLKKNQNGGYCRPGMGDDIQWTKIYDVIRSNSSLKQREIAQAAQCSLGLVSKVLHSTTGGPLHQSQYKHSRTEHIFDENDQFLLREYLDNGVRAKSVPGLFREMGNPFHSSTIYKHINKSLNYSLKQGVTEDPRKWSDVCFFFLSLYIHTTLSYIYINSLTIGKHKLLC